MSDILTTLYEIREELKGADGLQHLGPKLTEIIDALGDLQTDADKGLLTLQILQDDLHLTDQSIPKDTILHLAANNSHYSTLSFIVVDYLERIRDALTDTAGSAGEERTTYNGR